MGQFSGLRSAADSGYTASMTGRKIDPRTTENAEGDFADEHSKPTHADEHPLEEQLETDESTPEGYGGSDI